MRVKNHHYLELNQQYVAQQTEHKKKEDRVTVQESETLQGIEIEEDEEKRNKEGSREEQEDSKEEPSSDESDQSGGSLIDIKV